MTTTIDALQGRYATKAYDTTKVVSDQDFNTILEAMRLAPSAFGLQPWKFIVVKNPELRATLKEHSYGQSQITDASHLIVLCAKKSIDSNDIAAYMNAISNTRNVPLEQLDGFKKYLEGSTTHLDSEAMETRNTKQVYIALGTGLTAAAELHIDTTPMEGFDKNKYNEVLGLTDYTAAVVLAVGYRSADDATQNYAKVRYAMNSLIDIR